MKRIVIIGLLLSMTACSTAVVQQPADPAVVKDIEQVCLHSGFFKFVNDEIVLAVPKSSIPIGILNAGVAQVCQHPEQFASDVSTVEWLVKTLQHYTKKSTAIQQIAGYAMVRAAV